MTDASTLSESPGGEVTQNARRDAVYDSRNFLSNRPICSSESTAVGGSSGVPAGYSSCRIVSFADHGLGWRWAWVWSWASMYTSRSSCVSASIKVRLHHDMHEGLSQISAQTWTSKRTVCRLAWQGQNRDRDLGLPEAA